MNLSLASQVRLTFFKLPEKRKITLKRSLIRKIMQTGFVSAILFIATSLQLLFGSPVKSQTIDDVKIHIGLNNETLVQAFHKIEAHTSFRFMYRNDEVQNIRNLDVKPGDRTVGQLLRTILSGTSLTYRQVNNQVLVMPLSSGRSPYSMNLISAPNMPEYIPKANIVKGRVTNAQGEPLAGVSVTIKGTQTGTLTDENGDYSLDVPPTGTLVFSFVGFTAQEVSVNGRSSIDISLVGSVSELEQVVVVGYGTQKKSDLTGSVSSINSGDFVQGVATDALQLISGKAAGVDVSQANSEPGGKLNIRVRGVGSINSSNTALIVIDGVPGGSTANINPADIESIDILKDASSAAIYGTRAANGVVLITTKKGKQGPARITYNTYLALQSPAAKLNVLDGSQYMNYLNDISKDEGRSPVFTEEQIKAIGKGTNWQDQLFRKALATNHQLSIGGGNENVKYYSSLRYLSQNGILISSGINQYNFITNLEITPNDKFKFAININGNRNDKNKIANESSTGNENADPLNAATQFDPTIGTELDANGRYQLNPTVALDNPIALANGYNFKEQNSRLFGSVLGEYKILTGLKATIRLGGDFSSITEDDYTEQITQKGLANGGIGELNELKETYWLAEGLINYDKSWGNNNLAILGGATWEKFMTTTQGSYATGFLSDVTQTNLLQSGNVSTFRVTSSRSSHKLQSFFGRANYTLLNKYLFTATIRSDGTSRFSKKNQYAIFPSVALGWKLTEEEFMSHAGFVNNLKLRISYGRMGNEGIGNFATIPTYVAGGNTVLGGVIVNGAQPARLPNPDLKWETTAEYNFGLDYGLWNNRISGSVEYYIKNTFDQLFDKPVPLTTGFSTILTNFGNVKNKGIDFSLNSRNLVGKLGWETSLSISTLKNKVAELPPFIGRIITGGIIANIPGFSIVEQGSPMYAYYGYRVDDIFRTQGEIDKSAQPDAKLGWPKFFDANNDGKIDASDRVILGNPYPSFIYSIGNTFSYHNFSLNIYFTGVSGIKTFNGNIVESMFPINFERNIISRYYFDRWTPENPNAEYPSGANSSVYFGNGRMINSYSIQDASYFRLKNLTLNYRVPIDNSRIFKAASISLTGENLFTITNFIGYDPAANQTGDGTSVAKSSYNNYPIARIISLGASFTF